MTTHKRILAIAGAILGACATAPGGMYSKPYAIIEAERTRPAADTRPATVMKIDGRNVSLGKDDPVEPGMRSVEVSIPGPPGMSDPDRDTLQIDAKPCTRYYLVAQKSNPLMTRPTARDWRAFISSTEPINECVKRFEGK